MQKSKWTCRTLGQEGLTLIEILIATVILAFLVLGINSATENSTRTKEQIIREDAEYLKVVTAMSRLERDLVHLYSPLNFAKRFNIPQEEGFDSRYESLLSKFNQNKNFAFPTANILPVPIYKADGPGQFEFLTASNRRRIENSRQSYFVWVRYQLMSQSGKTIPENATENEKKDFERKKDLMQLMRYSAPQNIYDNTDEMWENAKGQILLDNVVEMKFSFWDSKNKRFQESLSNITQGRNYLEGVKIQLKWKDADGNEIEEEKIVIPLWPKFRAEKEDRDVPVPGQAPTVNPTTNPNVAPGLDPGVAPI